MPIFSELFLIMATILYKRQKQILDYINQNIDKYGYAPTLTEIAQRSLATRRDRPCRRHRRPASGKTSCTGLL